MFFGTRERKTKRLVSVSQKALPIPCLHFSGLCFRGEGWESGSCCYKCLESQPLETHPNQGEVPRYQKTCISAKIATAVAGGAVAVGAVPTVLGAMGFTSAGIAASSIAAKMMSVAAISNGGGVAAGSLVATLQSVGAAGLSMSSKVLLGSAGSALVSRMMGL
ncbi:interferon alpha-inducible protein 27, mitochondrial-like isoform X5 [Manis pentadactyla]|uniref:interferon alpha-inducible protein 27, mitochondrial-like isoform X5 n=1 Tax=Manis pentadactyla TaxID=143292 RepID=UPI00255CFF97|nr:interferon alpha-inducible protein 27, mitochondrial-like isoform X5 [Manis pentadactyla]